jgi:4-hydroxy-tetrahydrodipicolinate synthase
LYRHYAEILERTEIPVILYNVPSRTGCNLEPQTAAELADHERVVGLKEASGDLKQACRAIELCGDRLSVVSGEDFLSVPMIAVGGAGVISVVANVVPKGFGTMVRAALEGRMGEARKLHYRYMDLADALFLETNPVPAKTALAMMDLMEEDVRLPLCPMSGPNREKLADVLQRHELIEP